MNDPNPATFHGNALMTEAGMLKMICFGLVVVLVALWARNASVLVRNAPQGDAQWIAHRGVHQTYDREGLTNETCTAERIHPPTHPFLENTIPSMKAAFEAGADVVEIDVHLTVDGTFVVWHDRTLDCRTEGQGVTRKHDIDELKLLDIGYGYTADGGQTFPFRAQGYGPMPSLAEVFVAVPEGRFLINFKSRRAQDGEALIALLSQNRQWAGQVWGVYGGAPPTEAVLSAYPDLDGLSRVGLKACAKGYVSFGWTGYVPHACRNTTLMIPISHVSLVWGWPTAFMARMDKVGTSVILTGPYKNGDPGTAGIDTPEIAARVPQNYNGYIWTNKIEEMVPASTFD